MTADGFSDPYNFHGKEGTIFAVGSFGGGTVRLQASIDGTGNWFDCTDPTGLVGGIAVNGILNFDIAPCVLRAALSGSTAPSVTIKISER